MEDEGRFNILHLGDEVKLVGFSANSPWEGLTGEITWIDPDESLEEFQTITVRVNFPTENGMKQIEQNFDRRNVIKE